MPEYSRREYAEQPPSEQPTEHIAAYNGEAMPVPRIQRPVHSIQEYAKTAANDELEAPAHIAAIRYIGAVPVTHIFANLKRTDTDNLFDQLDDCDIVALDGRAHAQYTRQLEADEKHTLRARDVRHIDVAPATPGWQEYTESRKYAQEFTWSMSKLPLYPVAIRVGNQLIEKIATSDTAREAYMQDQLEAIVAEASSRADNPRVGAIFELSHIPLLAAGDDTMHTESTTPPLTRLINTLPPASQAVMAYRNGKNPQPHIRQLLLQAYVDAAFAEQPDKLPRMQQACTDWSPSRIIYGLKQIDQAIVGVDEYSRPGRAAEVIAALAERWR
jgi:hypothetical protein